METDISKKILEELKLKNVDKENKKLIICFAGIPCSGKTCLAKKIEKRYRGVRISNDAVRKILAKSVKVEEKREKILQKWLLNFLEKYPFKNKLVILDSGIERKYSEIVKIVKHKKWKMFIIRVVEKKETILKRIKKKDRNRFENRYEDIVRWFREFKEFNKRVKPDFIFKKNSDLKKLFVKLDKIN